MSVCTRPGILCLNLHIQPPFTSCSPGNGWASFHPLPCGYLLSLLATPNTQGHPAETSMPCLILVPLLLGAAVLTVPVTSCPEKTPPHSYPYSLSPETQVTLVTHTEAHYDSLRNRQGVEVAGEIHSQDLWPQHHWSADLCSAPSLHKILELMV